MPIRRQPPRSGAALRRVRSFRTGRQRSSNACGRIPELRLFHLLQYHGPARVAMNGRQDYRFIFGRVPPPPGSRIFAEWANVHGNCTHGTPAGPVLETLKAGQDVLFDIDVQGAAQLHLAGSRGT